MHGVVSDELDPIGTRACMGLHCNRLYLAAFGTLRFHLAYAFEQRARFVFSRASEEFVNLTICCA